MERYFRILYGVESFEWVNGEYMINRGLTPSVKCGATGFEADALTLGQLGIIDNGWCPDLTENFNIKG